MPTAQRHVAYALNDRLRYHQHRVANSSQTVNIRCERSRIAAVTADARARVSVETSQG
jgi:hypothetical protein